MAIIRKTLRVTHDALSPLKKENGIANGVKHQSIFGEETLQTHYKNGWLPEKETCVYFTLMGSKNDEKLNFLSR